jgi:hypothetical protein
VLVAQIEFVRGKAQNPHGRLQGILLTRLGGVEAFDMKGRHSTQIWKERLATCLYPVHIGSSPGV